VTEALSSDYGIPYRKKQSLSQVMWLTSVIPATQKAEIVESLSETRPGKKHKTLPEKIAQSIKGLEA
jgi:hypothetical protein